MRRRNGPTLLGAVALAVLAQACSILDSGEASPPAPDPLIAVACPDDVRSSVVADADCAALTVAERPDGSGRRITVFVTTIHGPEGAETREPVVVPSLSDQPNYGGIAPLAQRVGRDVIIVDTRGTAHSTPRLECSEVRASEAALWETPSGDAASRSQLLDAVAACHRRWTAAGVDLASYDVARAASDLEQLRSALGIDRWNVVAHGAGSRVALELLRTSPAAVRAVVLDSPDVPGTDPRAVAGPATRRAVRRVLASCSLDDRCRQEHPAARGLLDRAMAGTARRPLRLGVELAGARQRVVVDPAFVARALRQLMSDGGSSGPVFRPVGVPDFLEAVSERRHRALDRAVGRLTRYEGPLCLGFRPSCLPAHHSSLAVELTVLCRDVHPFSESVASRLGPGFREAFAESFWWDVCDVWPVGRTSAGVADPPQSAVPVLVALGAYATYSPGSVVRPALSGLRAASYVVDPGGAHNVLPRPCVAAVRNAWLEDPRPLPRHPCRSAEGISWDD